MKTLVSPDQLPNYGFPRYSNRHRKRLEDKGVLPARVPITYHRHAYVESELIEKAKNAIARRDAVMVAAE
jgi:hypothetical protein